MPKAKSVEEVLPVGTQVLVSVHKDETQTELGIALPDTAVEKETVFFGEVLAIPGLVTKLRNENNIDEIWIDKIPTEYLKIYYLGIEVGDTVVCKKFDYSKVKIGSEDGDYRLYSADSIVAVIKKK